MSVKIKGQNIQEIYFGNLPIAKIYCGSQLLFEKISAAIPSFSGRFVLGEGSTPQKGYMQILSDGTLTFLSDLYLELFLVGHGGNGKKASDPFTGGSGGTGGETKITSKKYSKNAEISVKINGSTSFDTFSTITGGGKQGGKGADFISSAAQGEKGVQPFNGDVAPFSTMLFYGAGGGGSGSKNVHSGANGGETGGGKGADFGKGKNGTSGEKNMGAGGGGSSNGKNSQPGQGSDGTIFLRWGNWN